MGLVRRLAFGPVDVIGDVHGEADALDALLSRLGYIDNGLHPSGRRPVFLGDLGDRGPDSPAVFDRVRGLVEADRADCLLGNHELNLLRLAPKAGNGWFWPASEDHDLRRGEHTDARRLPDAERERLVAFLRGLPLALERDDLRVVHACWHAPSIELLRASDTCDAIAAYDEAEAKIEHDLSTMDFAAAALKERHNYESQASDPSITPLCYPNFAKYDEQYQNRNPVRALTSGIERVVAAPFYSTGKWRLLERVPWWEDYVDEQAVFFGHYWRVPAGMDRLGHKGIGNLLAGYADEAWLGRAERAYCVDFCVGARHRERERGVTQFQTRLAALRWPEATLVMDDGRAAETQPGASAHGVRA